MLVQKNANSTTLTIARDARRHAATVPANAEEWLDRNRKSQPNFSFYCSMFVLDLMYPNINTVSATTE